MPDRLLVVEDEEHVRAVITRKFRAEGYEVFEAETGAEGLHLVEEEKPDVILLDIRLPDIDGVSVCQEARRMTSVPILMLTAEVAPETAIRALAVGANDYIRKPVDLGELVARVQAALRTATLVEETDGVIEAGPLSVDETNAVATYRGRDIGASATEIRLLGHLARNAGRLLTREQLVKAAWEGERDPHLIEVHVSNLRKKLREAGCQEQLIRTVQGRGYRLSPI